MNKDEKEYDDHLPKICLLMLTLKQRDIKWKQLGNV